jgi:hypothetical protein
MRGADTLKAIAVAHIGRIRSLGLAFLRCL